MLCDVATWVDTGLPIKRSRGSLVTVTVIQAYLSFIFKAVAAERVAECGELLPKIFVFPIYSELHPNCLKREQKVADVCQNLSREL